MTDRSFIEDQFPIAPLSAESYKERKANLGQTLTRLGKWWGRKPLVLVRASVLGLLLPASTDPSRQSGWGRLAAGPHRQSIPLGSAAAPGNRMPEHHPRHRGPDG